MTYSKSFNFKKLLPFLTLATLSFGFLNCSNRLNSQFSEVTFGASLISEIDETTNVNYVRFDGKILLGANLPRSVTNKKNDQFELFINPDFMDSSVNFKFYLNGNALQNSNSITFDISSVKVPILISQLPQGEQRIVFVILAADGKLLEQYEYKWFVKVDQPIFKFAEVPSEKVTSNLVTFNIERFGTEKNFSACWLRDLDAEFLHFHEMLYINCNFPLTIEYLKNNKRYEFKVQITNFDDSGTGAGISSSEIKSFQFRTEFSE